MKKFLFSMLLTFATIAFVNTSSAQVKVNINIGDQPEWGPAGYNYAEYYYMPDIETYYYVPKKQFVYFSGNKWVFANTLPPTYAGYNLYSGYKAVFNTPDAYKQFNQHKVKYVKFKNYGGRQVIIKNHHDNGNHYGQYKNKNKGNGNSNGKGNGKGKGHGKKSD
jgi:hypothetical protein